MQNKVAIVTGAGKGLGRAYALELARRGASVLVNNRVREGQPNSADLVVAEIENLGGRACASYDHAEVPGSGENMVATALESFGRLDTVIANAGIDSPQSFHKQAFEDFQQIFAVNFTGTASLLHAAWPVMREAGYGRVLVSTSSAGLYGNHGQAAYSASKAALIGLMRSLALEAGERDICINALAPYAVTPLTLPWFPEELAQLFSAEAVANIAAWLVSPSCAVSGKVLISGAGRLRQARALETGTVPLGDDPAAVIRQLEEMAPGDEPGSANEEFNAFAGSL